MSTPEQPEQLPGVSYDSRHPERKLSLEVASAMMIAWRDRNPAVWGYWHATALNGVAPSRTARDLPAGGAQ